MVQGVEKQSQIQHRYALLIGVSDYGDMAYKPLRQTANEVVKLERILKKYGYAVRTLQSRTRNMLEKPTRVNIMAELKSIAQKTGPGDLLLVHFGGHGDLDQRNNAYLIPSDGRKSELKTSAVNLEAFKGLILSSHAQARILFLDACHSGPGRNAGRMSAQFERHVFLEARGTATLASCRQNEIAYNLSKKHGVFTYYLLEGLKGGAAQHGKRYITFDDLKNFVTHNVKKWTTERGVQQRPNYKAQLEGDPPLLKLEILKPPTKRSLLFRVVRSLLIIAIVLTAAFIVRHYYNKNRLNRYLTNVYTALPTDNIAAARWAQKAYGFCEPQVPTRVLKAVSDTVVSTLERPFPSIRINHHRSVNHIEASPKENTILTASSDGTAKLWDTETGNLLQDFPHQKAVNSARFSPGGDTILTHSNGKEVLLWNLKGKILASFKHEGPITSALFSPDGNRVLTTSEDFTAKLWSQDGSLLTSFQHNDVVTSAVFSPNQDLILTALYDRTAVLWDVKGVMLTTFDRHSNMVNIVRFAPKGDAVLTVSRFDPARLWDLKGKLLATFKHNDVVTDALFSPWGDAVLTAHFDGNVKLWALDGKLITALLRQKGEVGAIAFSPDGSRILTASTDNIARVWDTGGNLVHATSRHDGSILCVGFLPDGKRIMTASQDQSAKVWDFRDQLATRIFKHKTGLTFSAISPQGDRVLLVPEDGTFLLCNLNGDVLRTFNGHKRIINCAAFSPDGSKILTASADTTARVWDERGESTALLKGHSRNLNWCVFSPDGMLCLTASDDHTVKLWDLKGNLIATPAKHRDKVNCAAFSPDGKLIITASTDATAKLCDLEGKEIWVFFSKGAEFKHACFTPDGTRILTSTSVIKLWDLNGTLLETFNLKDLNLHSLPVTSVEFSGDGSRILTASYDKKVNLWGLDGTIAATYTHQDIINRALFGPYENCVLTVSDDKTAVLWRTPKGAMQWLRNKNTGALIGQPNALSAAKD